MAPRPIGGGMWIDDATGQMVNGGDVDAASSAWGGLGWNNSGLQTQVHQQLAPKVGEDYDGWLKRISSLVGTSAMSTPGASAANGNLVAQYVDYVRNNRASLEGKMPGSRGQGAPGLGTGAAGGPSAPTNYEDELMKFYRHMTGPLDMNDPEVKQAMAVATNVGQKQSALQGIRGGLATSGISKMAVDSLAPIQNQRRQQGLQALMGGANHSLGLSAQGMQAQAQAFDQNQSNQINAANQQRAGLQALGTAAGQLGSGLIEAFGKNSAAPAGQAPNMGGSGSFNTTTGMYGSDPSDWNSYGGGSGGGI